MKLVTLYKETKTGAIQQYDIETIDDTYVVSQGQVGGKMQEYVTVCEPKNVGKKNETSASAQAKSEALSKHAKQIKKGYTTDPSGEVHVRLPQKVQTYSKHMKKVVFPCYESPKLNGVNATYRWVNDTLELTSRGGEQYPLIDQQIDRIKAIMTQLLTNELNGELYIHGEALQDITGAVKKYKDLSSKLEFHIFDLPALNGWSYDRRLELLNKIEESDFVKVVPVHLANSHKGLNDTHDTYVEMGYEGMVIRNKTGLYVHNERSNDVFKLKKAQDAEFQVEFFKLDKSGHAVFSCIYGEEFVSASDDAGIYAEEQGSGWYQSKCFNVKLKGTNTERLEMAANAESYIGEWLKVEYEMLSNIGKPLKPVGIMFRKVGPDGEALE